MNIELTDLIVNQLKAVGTMAAAGVLIAVLWNIKNKFKSIIAEIIFWIIAAITVPMFLYYCTYGKITFCALLGMVTGLVIYKFFISKFIK